MKKIKLKRKIPKREKPMTTLLVDSKYLAYRQRFTQGAQLSYNEINTTVFYGVINSLLSLAKKFEINKCVICADTYTSVRKKQYPEYKVKKYSKTLSEYDLKLNELFKEEYNNLLEHFKKIGFGFNAIEGYEADDLIAIYCNQYMNKENIIIVSRDEDLYQCLDEKVMLFSPDDKIKKTDKWFKKEYGIEPLDWNMVKAMAGCSSDNVSGIKGIGEETALKYLREEATEKQIQKIKDNWETVEKCLQVVTLPHPDLQNGFVYDFIQSDINVDKFINFCQVFGFRQFLDNISDFKTYFMKK